MKKRAILAALTVLVSTAAAAGCAGVGRGMAGNLYEKAGIFSLITLTVIAVILVPFVSGLGDSRAAARYRELVRSAAVHPLSAEALTAYPVYIWEYRKSFRKVLFGTDGRYAESTSISSNGLDPDAAVAGSWEISPEGRLLLRPKVTQGTREYAGISRDGHNLPTVMRLKSGSAEAWFLGERGLALAQISCFGYSESVQGGKFTREMLSGRAVYWASYPCIVPVSSFEVAVNPALAFGKITFHEDGVLSRSIGNSLEATPDYTRAFTGSWEVDASFGALRVAIGADRVEYHLLLEAGRALIVSSAMGAEQWFPDAEHGLDDLANYLAVGAYLDASLASRFRGPGAGRQG